MDKRKKAILENDSISELQREKLLTRYEFETKKFQRRNPMAHLTPKKKKRKK